MKSRMLGIDLPQGHDWKGVAPGWLPGNEYAWECADCRQQLIGIMEEDGSFELLDIDDLEPCSPLTAGLTLCRDTTHS